MATDELSAFPNPTVGEVLITGIASTDLHSIMISDMRGSVQHSVAFRAGAQANTVQLDLGALATGVYVLQIRTKAELRSVRLVKQ
ncbi:MAG: T9SS type A sorting domain-containing protein [Flavobacteriales bacterium]|nr:T9SS type A sorting domain-containing protein [Flavobacteriales bacterium]